jgi:BirA family biotin operon repressor/biotin-[acetyl-CoA-carboxylase] ligase
LTAKKYPPGWIVLDSIDSTNNYAMALLRNAHLPTGQEAAEDGTVVFAHHQTAGKGQRGKKWVSEAGTNLSYSMIIRPFFLQPWQLFHLQAAVAVSICNTLKKIIGDETSIKWPNDLYWRDRKTGGILIENVFRGNEWEWAVIGIGININQTNFGELGNKAVSIKQITGKEQDILNTAELVKNELTDTLQQLKTNGFDPFFNAYNELLFMKNKTVALQKQNRVFQTTITGVNEQGQLVTRAGQEELFDFGAVEWKL